MAVVRYVAHDLTVVIENRDRRGLAVKRGAHDVLLFILCSRSGCQENPFCNQGKFGWTGSFRRDGERSWQSDLICRYCKSVEMDCEPLHRALTQWMNMLGVRLINVGGLMEKH
jgi:hypothetical protein